MARAGWSSTFSLTNRRRATYLDEARRMQQFRRIIPALMFLLLLATTTKDMFEDQRNVSRISRLLRAVTDKESPCSTVPTLHDLNPFYVTDYDDYFHRMLKSWNEEHYDAPDMFNAIPTNSDGVWLNSITPKADHEPRFFTFTDGAKFLMKEDVKFGFPQSVAWKDEAFVPVETISGHTEKVWEAPTEEDEVRPVDRNLTGNYVAYVSWFNGNFGHFLHDHLPVIAWLRENVEPDVKFLLLHHPEHEVLLRTVDADFEDRRVIWIERNELVQVSNGTLTVSSTMIPYRNLRPIESLGRWLLESHPPAQLPLEKRTVLYYTRGGSADTHHGRIVEPQHEQDILETIRRAMKKHNRPEELVIFNGRENGETMPIQHQFELFRSATAVIGPHGSGLGNIVWMDPSGTPPTSTSQPEPSVCVNKPKILEFLLGPDSTQVHPPCSGCKGSPFSRTYYTLFSGIPWMDYHHILYAPNSTEPITYVDLRALESGLDALFKSEDTETLPPSVEASPDLNDSAPSEEEDVALDRHLSLTNMATTPASPSDIPVFFHMPRDGTSMKWILGACLGLTLANGDGVQLELTTSDLNNNEYGRELETAAQTGSETSRPADVVVTPDLYPSTQTLFDSDHKARVFTMIRHPIQRAASMMNFFETAGSTEEYDHVENNWMVRFLTGELNGTLDESHLELAKQILRDHCLVGLVDEKEASLQRFVDYFGWDFENEESRKCRDDAIWNDAFDFVGKISPATADLLYDQNLLDIELYEYALEIYEDQAQLFEAAEMQQ